MFSTYFTAALLLTSALAAPYTPTNATHGDEIVFLKTDAQALEGRKVMSNGERMSRGMVPAWPAAVDAAVPNRSRNSVKRKALAPRASIVPCAARAPLQVNPTSVLYQVDDGNILVNLPFQLLMFGQTSSQLTITTNGIYRLGDVSTTRAVFDNTALPNAGQGTAVAAYWDDLLTGVSPAAGTTEGLFYEATATTLNIRHIGEQYANNGAKIDFTMYYTTANPGVYTVYVDRSDGNGVGATVGAQGPATSPQAFVQFSFNSEVLFAGTVIVINTNGAGSVSSYQRCPV